MSETKGSVDYNTVSTRTLFLKLWDKAVEKPDYVKAEWVELQLRLLNAGLWEGRNF